MCVSKRVTKHISHHKVTGLSGSTFLVSSIQIIGKLFTPQTLCKPFAKFTRERRANLPVQWRREGKPRGEPSKRIRYEGSLEATSWAVGRNQGRDSSELVREHCKSSATTSFPSRDLSYGDVLRLARAGLLRARPALQAGARVVPASRARARRGLGGRCVAHGEPVQAPGCCVAHRAVSGPVFVVAAPGGGARHSSLWIEEGQEAQRAGGSRSEGFGQGGRG